MITKDEILATGASAMRSAFLDWLNENCGSILQIAGQALARPVQEKPKDWPSAASPPRPYLTVAEVASRWNCCVHTVRRKIQAGALPGVMLSQRHILVPLTAVLKLEKDATSSRP